MALGLAWALTCLNRLKRNLDPPPVGHASKEGYLISHIE